jgi:hypothetical protein
LIKKYLGGHLKYHKDEHETFKELLNTREKNKKAFMKLQTALNDKKEKLFKAKDVTKWGHTDIKEL